MAQSQKFLFETEFERPGANLLEKQEDPDTVLLYTEPDMTAARREARVTTLDPTAEVTVLADDLSLAERGIPEEALRDNVNVSGVDALTDLIMEDGCKPLWT